MFYRPPAQDQRLDGILDSLLTIGTTVYQKYVDITAVNKAKAKAAEELRQMQEMQALQEQVRVQQAKAATAAGPTAFGISQNTLLIAGGVLAAVLLLKRR